MRVGRRGFALQALVEHGELVLVVENRDDIVESFIEDVDNVLDVLFFLESVADDDLVFVDKFLRVQFLYKVDVECAGGLQIDVVLQSLFHNKAEMAALGAVAVVIAAFVVSLGDGDIEHPLGALDLGTNLRQIGYLERSAVLFDYFHQWDVVEIELAVLSPEFVLWEFKGLVNQVVIFVSHRLCCFSDVSCMEPRLTGLDAAKVHTFFVTPLVETYIFY